MIPTIVNLTPCGFEKKVKFPTNREYIKIMIRKNTLAEGSYASLAHAARFDKQCEDAIDLIDAVAYLTVLIPDLPKLFKVKDVDSLLAFSKESDQTKELLRVFREEYSPFHNQIEIRKDRSLGLTIALETNPEKLEGLRHNDEWIVPEKATGPWKEMDGQIARYITEDKDQMPVEKPYWQFKEQETPENVQSDPGIPNVPTEDLEQE